MKYLRQENNHFIFDDGGDELSCRIGKKYENNQCIHYMDVKCWDDFDIEATCEPLSDIQTAVQMMTILKDKGLV